MSSLSSASSNSSGSTASSRTSQSWSSRSSFSSYSLSSLTSLSFSSESSSSSSSSSLSTESSAWDTGSEIVSYLAVSIIPKHGKFISMCRMNLTYDDAMTCMKFGPCEIDIGGLFNGETVPNRVVQLCDERVYTWTFITYEAARQWAFELRRRAHMMLSTARSRRAVFGPYFVKYRERTLP